jgi:hypothetical protein
MLAGCVGWTGATALKSVDGAIYAGHVDTSPAVFVGPLPAMAYPFTYTVQHCFSDVSTVKDVPGLILGSDPVDVVCRQYKGVDLRDYPAETADCFIPDPEAGLIAGSMFHDYPRQHPWRATNPAPACAKLIADIEAAKKSK